MYGFYYYFIFIFGLIIGSFLNCVIYRLEIGKKPFGRSFCPRCKHKLSWQDLIPVLSFVILKGKCRYCHKKISIQYPLVELATGFLFLFTVYGLRFTVLEAVFYLIINCFLIIVFVYDLKHYIIPDKVIFPAIIITFFYQLFRVLDLGFGHWDFIFSAFLASGFFLAIVLISKGRWMGMGDVKLAFFMGLFLGFPQIFVALFLSFFIGAIIGIGLIALNKKGLKSEIPFGPFLVVGTFIALFYGEQIINWYLSLFL